MLSRTTKAGILLCGLLLLTASLDCKAQFKDEAFSQNYNDSNAPDTTSGDKIFDVKKYFGALGHRTTMDVSTAFEGSLLCVGGMQIYNKDYWKLPIVYGGIAAGIGGGIYYNQAGNSTASTLCYAGAALMYWGSFMDGVICYKPGDWPNPQKATLYSLLLPGLGQIYNRELWKLPVYWGVMGGSLSYYFKFKANFERFRAIYNSGDTTYISTETAKYYKDLYRRYRDYALLVTFAGYLLQVIDANVFAYMHDFEISDDISMSISPTLISPNYAIGNNYAYSSTSSSTALGVGLRLNF